MWCSPSQPCKCQHISQKSKESAQTLVQTKTLRHQGYFTGGETKLSIIAVFGVTMADNWQKHGFSLIPFNHTLLFYSWAAFISRNKKSWKMWEKHFSPTPHKKLSTPHWLCWSWNVGSLFILLFPLCFVCSLSLHPPPVSLWGHAFNWWWIVMSIWGKYVSVHV